MKARIDWNVVTLLRIIGLAIIIVGIVLAAFDASAINTNYSDTLGFTSSQLHHAPMRTFLRESIDYVWKGGLVIVGAEVANQFGWGGGGQDEPADEEMTP